MKINRWSKKLIVMMSGVAVVAVALVIAVVQYFRSEAFAKSNAPKGAIIIAAILAALLPLLIMLFLAAIKKQGGGTVVINTDKVSGEVVSDGGSGGGDKSKGGTGTRFYMLNRIDGERIKYRRAEYDEEITLKQLCESFREFASYRLRLYYDMSDIRKFIAGLAVSRIIILQGISGTGKTSLAYAWGEYLDNTTTVIPVQPMWKERTDLIGYYNEFTKRFNETTLLQKMYEANYSKDMYVTLLDEMNIARIEYYFAEFLSLLELPDTDKRYLDVVSDEWDNDPVQLKNGQIKLPDNMWFVGTANNDDTTFSISDKVYDRAMILNLDSKAEPFRGRRVGRLHMRAERFCELVSEAQVEYGITARNLNRLEELDRYMIENFHLTFGNRIRKQIMTYIPVYLSCGGEELEALDDILAKKLIRKLEMQNPVYLSSASAGLVAKLEELFGADSMKQCKAYIARIVKNA